MLLHIGGEALRHTDRRGWIATEMWCEETQDVDGRVMGLQPEWRETSASYVHFRALSRDGPELWAAISIAGGVRAPTRCARLPAGVGGYGTRDTGYHRKRSAACDRHLTSSIKPNTCAGHTGFRSTRDMPKFAVQPWCCVSLVFRSPSNALSVYKIMTFRT